MAIRGNHILLQSNPVLGSDNYYVVSIGKDNAKWISNWGAGIALLNDTGKIVKVFNGTNGIPLTEEPIRPIRFRILLLSAVWRPIKAVSRGLQIERHTTVPPSFFFILIRMLSIMFA